QQYIDINKIMDSLPETQAAVLQEILDHIVIGGNEEEVFSDCVHAFEDGRLAKEEQRLLTLLSMADEENNQERIIALTDQLIDVQKKRKRKQ
ncbi:MAG: hypothetical protein ACLRWH_13555, partial [Emergencia sp.]